MEYNQNTNNQMQDENKFASLGNVAMIAFALFVIYLFFWFAKSSGNVAYVAIGIGVIAVGALVYFYFSSLLPTDNRIISKLREAGFECGMEEGRICFRKDDYTWQIFTSDVSRRYRKVIFCLACTDDALDKDHALVNRIICIIGDRNHLVSTSWNGKNGVRFLYHTVFASTKDIMREFYSATQAVETAAGEFSMLINKAFTEGLPNEEHKVGFQFGEKQEIKDHNVRAQKDIETEKKH